MEPGIDFHTHHTLPKTIAANDIVDLHNLGFTETEVSLIDPIKFGLLKDKFGFNLDEIVTDEYTKALRKWLIQSTLN